jgi:hypothetical protein
MSERRPPLAAIDWEYLRIGLARPLGLLAIAVLIFGASQYAANRSAAALADTAASLDSEAATRRQAAADRDTAETYASRYVALVEQGGIGEEQRLGWADTLRRLATDLELPYLRFSSGPRRAVAAERLPPDAANALVSPMDLQLGLVHEGDLLRLFDGLTEAPGVFAVQGCRLERAGDVAPEPGRANVSGSCQLLWLSVDPAATLPAEDAA